MSNPNPWNSDTPWAVDNIWTVSSPIIEARAKKISGDPSKDWLQYACEAHLAHTFGRTASGHRCLIMGSTELRVEKTLWQYGYDGEIVSTDIADKAMARSRVEAERMGKRNATFVVADLNTARPTGPFDFVIASGILHHIEQQEACLDMLMQELAPGGLLIAAEFTGPFRFQLPPIQVALINAMLAMMPAGMRNPPALGRPPMEPLPPEDHWARPFAPIAEDLLVSIDPSEAVSGQRLDQNLLARFDVVERIPVGGTLTTYLHEWLDYRTTNSGAYREWMRAFVDAEWRLISAGLLQSDYVIYILKNRRTEVPHPSS